MTNAKTLAKIKIRRCWEITLIDDDGDVIQYEDDGVYGGFSKYKVISFGTKEDAQNSGKGLLERYFKNIKQEGGQ